jgi:predicted ATP-grasp superfamily ATP-dependent carboligase
MEFPLVLKPARRNAAWMKASRDLKVVKVDTPSALREQGTALMGTVDELIVQGWVRGSDQRMYSLYACYDRSCALLASMMVRKIRQWPPDIGVGSLAEQVHEADVLDLGLRLLESVAFTGLACFQCKRDEVSGKVYIIEVNAGRPGLNLPICHRCGVEMLAIYYSAAAGLPLPEGRTVRFPGAKWICWKTDLASAFRHWRRGDLTPGGWWRSIQGRRFSADLDWGDPLPFLLDLIGKLPQALRRIGRG